MANTTTRPVQKTGLLSAFEGNDLKKDAGFPGLLRTWRGLRKCSQLVLAMEAEISQRHLSFLESGRSQPSREMVLRLAGALDLPLRDRNLLLTAAGFAPAYAQRRISSEEMAGLKKALQMQLDFHEPFPGIVVDRSWNMVLHNSAASRFLDLLGDMDERWKVIDPSGGRNIYRLTFHEQGLRRYIENWDLLSGMMLLRLQREVEADPFNPVLAELLAELKTIALEAGSKTFEQDLSALAPVIPMTVCMGDVRLSMISMISGFGSAIDVTAEELRVESFFPADSETEAFLRQLAD